MANRPLEGRLALVTGAGQGNGRAIALGLANAGARVLVTDRDGTTAQATAQLIEDAGGTASAHQLDVTRTADCAAFAASSSAQHGAVSILVNNAGVLIPARLGSPEARSAWERTFAVNVDGPYNMIDAFLPGLRETRGAVINVASIQSFVTGRNLVAYAASKGALLQLTRALAADLAAEGVRVNAIAPGLIDTPMLSVVKEDADRLKARLAHIPMRRLGQAEELAAAVVFLAGPGSSYITGAALPIDGGFLTL